jgi:hypothetical protein
MTNHGEKARLRLVRPDSTEARTESQSPKPSPDLDPQYKNFVQAVHLPFSKETLWLRVDPCSCGGARLYYVKLVDIMQLEEHKPYYRIERSFAEEIIYSQHAQVGRLHRFFGISPVRVVFKHIFQLRKKVLMRDFRLQQSLDLQKYFKDVFGV